MDGRVIKFRAWQKTDYEPIECRMKRVISLDFGFKKISYINEYQEEEYLQLDDVVLMQFTGLKDKSGNEIFVGDIVKGSGRPFEIIFKDGCFIGTIKNMKGWIDLRIFDYKKDHKKSLSIWEIIGNIYQNPELRKDVAK